jgi:hypothetical protein
MRSRKEEAKNQDKVPHLDFIPDDALYEILGHIRTKRDIEHALVVSKRWY